MAAMDLHVSIKAQTDQSLPDLANAISTFFNQRLNQCETAKYHRLPTMSKDKFVFLVRIKVLSDIKEFRKTVRRNLPPLITELAIRYCETHERKMLDDSRCVQIAVLTATPNAPPMIIGAVQVASGAPPPSQSLPPMVASNSGHQSLAQSVASGSKGQACTTEQMRSSDDAGIPTNAIKSIFSEKAPGQIRAFSSSRIVLQLSCPNLAQNLTEFKGKLTETIQAKTYQAGIHVAVTAGSQHLKVIMACEWKNPMYARAIRRTIESAMQAPLKIASLRCFEMDPSAIPNFGCSGLTWLQHSQPKGAAYTMSMEDFIEAIGNEVQNQEAQFLNCETLVQFRDDAKAKQVLLSNIHDVLRWRFRPAVHPQSDFRFRDPELGGQSLEVPPMAGHAECMSGRAPEAPSLDRDSLPDPAVALRESFVSASVTGDMSARTPRTSLSNPNARCRSLNFNGDSAVHNPSGAAHPASDRGVEPAGMFCTL